MKIRFGKFIGVLGIALVALVFASQAHAQVVPTNLWKPNYASSTIAPINSSLQVPCANIVGGCSSGGGVSTSTTNTFTVPQSFTGINNSGTVTSTGAAISGETDFGTSYPNIVIANAGFSGDLGTYMNSLCNSNTSGTLIFVPAMQPASSSWKTEITETNRCTYEGVGGGGTQWTWGGTSSTPAINLDFSDLPHTRGGGLIGISLINGSNNETTTAPYIGVEASGNAVNTSGGAHGILQWDTFTNFGTCLDEASGTYDLQVISDSFHGCGHWINFEPSSNSGESNTLAEDWFSDCGNASATACLLVQTSSVEDLFMTDDTMDNGQLQVDGNNQVFISHLETENSGGTYGNYIPIVEANDASVNVVISGWQAHNDGIQTSTTYAALVQVDGSFSINGLTVSKSGTASSTPEILTSVSGSSGSENFQLCNVVNAANSGNGYTNVFGGAANNAFPSSTFNGCVNILKGNYAYGTIETTNNNILYTFNGNGPVFENGIPASGNSGTSVTAIGGGVKLGAYASSTLQVFGTNSSTILIGASGTWGCLEFGFPGGESFLYGATSTPFYVATTTKPASGICE